MNNAINSIVKHACKIDLIQFIIMLFFLHLGWMKTGLVQKLLLRVKFTSNCTCISVKV